MKKNLFLSLLLCVFSVFAASDDIETDGEKVKVADFVKAFPPEIKTVAVISPASCPDRKLIDAAMAELRRGGIKVKPGKWIYDLEKKKGAKGASLERRLEDFYAAWTDPEVDLILCTRGGTGATDLIKALDWEKMKATPKKLIGFSNITAITSAMLVKHVGTPFAGPTLGRLYRGTPQALESFRLAMRNEPQKPFKLKALRGGDCEGGIYAGHLAMLMTVDQLPEFKVNPAGRIVFIECVKRTPEQLEKYWNSLLQSGFFKDVKAVVFGSFTQITPQKAVEPLLRKFADTLTCPVYYGYPFGHQPNIYTLDFNAHAEIKDGILTISPCKE